VRNDYHVRATRTGRWWAILVDELPAVHSQARRLDQIQSVAREAIALVLAVLEDSFDIQIQPDLASLVELKELIEETLRAREASDAARSRASAAMRHAVRELRDSGYTSRDPGALLGASNQRISQIDK
jgi:predicted RNase H-like HicB family nuclease